MVKHVILEYHCCVFQKDVEENIDVHVTNEHLEKILPQLVSTVFIHLEYLIVYCVTSKCIFNFSAATVLEELH